MNYPTTYEEALAFESHVAQLVAVNMHNSTKERSAETLSHLHSIKALLPPGLYRHFKGGEYEVIKVFEDVNTGICFVEYVAHYGIYNGEPGARVLVGKDSFLRPIDRPTYRGVRFVRLSADVLEI